MEKFEKEKLTISNIKTDYKNKFLSVHKFHFIWSFLSIPIFIIIIAAMIKLEHISLVGYGILFILIYCFVIVYFFMDTINLIRIKKEDFKLVSDKLILKQSGTSDSTMRSSTPDILIFKSYGKYIINECIHYPTSKQFAMREGEYFDTSKIDDEFYLVINNKNKILLAYNAKFFELQE